MNFKSVLDEQVRAHPSKREVTICSNTLSTLRICCPISKENKRVAFSSRPHRHRNCVRPQKWPASLFCCPRRSHWHVSASFLQMPPLQSALLIRQTAQQLGSLTAAALCQLLSRASIAARCFSKWRKPRSTSGMALKRWVQRGGAHTTPAQS